MATNLFHDKSGSCRPKLSDRLFSNMGKRRKEGTLPIHSKKKNYPLDTYDVDNFIKEMDADISQFT